MCRTSNKCKMLFHQSMTRAPGSCQQGLRQLCLAFIACSAYMGYAVSFQKKHKPIFHACHVDLMQHICLAGPGCHGAELCYRINAHHFGLMALSDACSSLLFLTGTSR